MTVVCILVFLLKLSHANPLGPGWHIGNAEAVKPGSFKNPTEQQKVAMAMAASASESPDEITDEIKSLARALQHDPKLIFEHVRNHIDYVPYWGWLKGATQTWLDRAGNDADQAALLGALLRESGYSVTYVYGTMDIPYYAADGKDLYRWLLATDSLDFYFHMVGGGVPIEAGNDYLIDRIWLKTTVDGQTVLLDPAFKSYQEIPGLWNLQGDMGYSRSALLSAAGGTTGSGYVQNMSESGLQSYLTQRCSSLLAKISSDYPNASVEEIIGGKEIIQEKITELPTSLPFSANEITTYTQIPDSLIHKVTVKVGSINKELSIPAIAGKRLSLSYNNIAVNAASLDTKTASISDFSMGENVSDDVGQNKAAITQLACTPTIEDMGTTYKGPFWLYEQDYQTQLSIGFAHPNDGSGENYDFNLYWKDGYEGWGDFDVYVDGNLVTVPSVINNNVLGSERKFEIFFRHADSQQDRTGEYRLGIQWYRPSRACIHRYEHVLTGVVQHNDSPRITPTSQTPPTQYPNTIGYFRWNIRNDNSSKRVKIINSAVLNVGNPDRFGLIESSGNWELSPGETETISVEYGSSSIGNHTGRIRLYRKFRHKGDGQDDLIHLD